MPADAPHPEALVVVNDVGPDRAGDILALFAQTPWARHRQRADVDRILASGHVHVGLADPATGRLVAFARALCDDCYKAIVEDVIVTAELRGQGVGHLLMDALVRHPRVHAVEEVELYCDPAR